MKIIAETQRFLLREITEDDLKDMYELDSNPEVHKYLGKKPVTSMEQSEKIIAYIRRQYKDYGIGRWAVIDKETCEFAGWSGLKYETELRENFNYYDLGYRLKQKFWGRGIATETSFKALEYAWDTLRLKEIYAAADVENIGSNKVLKKVGMQCVDTFKYKGILLNWYQIKK